MIGFNTNTLTVFDRSVIRTNWRKINEGPVKKAGLLVRKIAVQSIRKRKKNRPSPPGTPPYSRARGHPLRLIFSVPDTSGFRVFIGPIGFGAHIPVPAIQEFGKTVRRRVFVGPKSTRRRKRVMRSVKYPKRRFMGPALEKAAPMLPFMWRGSISEVA